jgi:hypothetical protein
MLADLRKPGNSLIYFSRSPYLDGAAQSHRPIFSLDAERWKRDTKSMRKLPRSQNPLADETDKRYGTCAVSIIEEPTRRAE